MSNERRWRPLGASLGAGAIYDGAFAVAILHFPAVAARGLGIVLPADPTYLRLVGVLLLLLAGIYAVAWREPERHGGIAVVAAAGRFAGFLFFLFAWRDGAPEAFLALAAGDLVFAILHAVFLWRATRA